MDAAKLNDWMQVIGIFAVVASLIFVGMQMRQTHEIALSETYQARAIASSQFSVSMAANSNLLRIFDRAASGELEQLSAEEISAARYMTTGVFFLYDNTHYQYTKGFVSEELWTSIRLSLKAGMTNPLRRKLLLERRDLMRPSFREVVDEIDREIAAEIDE